MYAARRAPHAARGRAWGSEDSEDSAGSSRLPLAATVDKARREVGEDATITASPMVLSGPTISGGRPNERAGCRVAPLGDRVASRRMACEGVLAIGCWPVAVGCCWLRAAGCWLLAARGAAGLAPALVRTGFSAGAHLELSIRDGRNPAFGRRWRSSQEAPVASRAQHVCFHPALPVPFSVQQTPDRNLVQARPAECPGSFAGVAADGVTHVGATQARR